MRITVDIPDKLGKQLEQIPNSNQLVVLALQQAVEEKTTLSAPEDFDMPKTIKEALEMLHKSQPFRDIKDPVAWQQEIRKDRELPYRQ